MGYWITDKHPACTGWGVVDSEFDLKACYKLRTDAIKGAMATADAHQEPYNGVWTGDTNVQHDGMHNGDHNMDNMV